MKPRTSSSPCSTARPARNGHQGTRSVSAQTHAIDATAIAACKRLCHARSVAKDRVAAMRSLPVRVGTIVSRDDRKLCAVGVRPAARIAIAITPRCLGAGIARTVNRLRLVRGAAFNRIEWLAACTAVRQYDGRAPERGAEAVDARSGLEGQGLEPG